LVNHLKKISSTYRTELTDRRQFNSFIPPYQPPEVGCRSVFCHS